MEVRRWVLAPYAIALLIIQLALVAGYAAFPDVTLLDLDKEYNFPSWFSGLQLAAIAAACLFGFEAERRQQPRPPPLHWVWVILAAGFFYLSSDEILALHERILTDTLRQFLPADSLFQAVLPWQLIFAPAILAAFIVVSVMLYTRLGSHPRLSALGLAGLGFWTLSFVFEGAAKPFFIPARLYRLEVALEETAEMLGGTCLLLAFASYAVIAFGQATPVRVVRWRWVLGSAAGLCLSAAVAIAGLTASNPVYLYRRAGDKFVKKHEYVRAVSAYEQAVAMRPDDAGLWRRLARATLKAERSDAAAVAYREAIALSPRDPKLQLNLGVALHRAGDFPGAIAAYEMALSIRPGYARAHKNLGVALEKHGDLEQAEAQYRLAIQHDDKMDDARRYLDNLLERRERQSKAQEH